MCWFWRGNHRFCWIFTCLFKRITLSLNWIMAPDVEWPSEKSDPEPLSTRFARWRHNQLLLAVLSAAAFVIAVSAIAGLVLYFQCKLHVYYSHEYATLPPHMRVLITLVVHRCAVLFFEVLGLVKKILHWTSPGKCNINFAMVVTKLCAAVSAMIIFILLNCIRDWKTNKAVKLVAEQRVHVRYIIFSFFTLFIFFSVSNIIFHLSNLHLLF